jgi:hypothetical protein
VHGNDRQGLERLARYGARGPVAESRLRRLDDGRYQYTPKKGVTFVVTAEQLVRRLVSLVPPAKTHLTSFHGVYAGFATLIDSPASISAARLRRAQGANVGNDAAPGSPLGELKLTSAVPSGHTLRAPGSGGCDRAYSFGHARFVSA